MRSKKKRPKTIKEPINTHNPDGSTNVYGFNADTPFVVQIPSVRKSTFGGDDANVLWSSGVAHQAYVGEHAR